MSVRWTSGGFVQKAGSKVGAAAGAAKASYLAGPSSSSGGSPKPSSNDDIQEYRNWQASRSSLSNLGTGKYWTGSDDAARSLGGMPVDFNRQQYNFRDIGARNTGRKFNFLPQGGKGEGGKGEGEKTEETDTTNNMTPGHSGILTPTGSSVLSPGQMPVALGRGGYNLTDVRYGGMAGEEIGNGSRPKAAGELMPARPALGTVTPALGEGRNVIESTAREIGKGPTPALVQPKNTDVGKTRKGGLGPSYKGIDSSYGPNNTAAAQAGR